MPITMKTGHNWRTRVGETLSANLWIGCYSLVISRRLPRFTLVYPGRFRSSTPLFQCPALHQFSTFHHPTFQYSNIPFCPLRPPEKCYDLLLRPRPRNLSVLPKVLRRYDLYSGSPFSSLHSSNGTISFKNVATLLRLPSRFYRHCCNVAISKRDPHRADPRSNYLMI